MATDAPEYRKEKDNTQYNLYQNVLLLRAHYIINMNQPGHSFYCEQHNTFHHEKPLSQEPAESDQARE